MPTQTEGDFFLLRLLSPFFPTPTSLTLLSAEPFDLRKLVLPLEIRITGLRIRTFQRVHFF